MKFPDAQVILQDLADSFGKYLSDAQVRSWYRRVFEYMPPDVAVKAADRIITEPPRDGKPNFFPSISHFLEVSRSIKAAASGQRVFEFEPGVWLPLDDFLAAQKEEKEWWDRYEITPEDQAANIERLHRAMEIGLGRPRREQS